MAKKMKIKKGDEVLVIAGKDKGKKGSIISVDTKNSRVIVEGVNISKTRRCAKKPSNENQNVIKEILKYELIWQKAAIKGTPV